MVLKLVLVFNNFLSEVTPGGLLLYGRTYESTGVNIAG